MIRFQKAFKPGSLKDRDELIAIRLSARIRGWVIAEPLGFGTFSLGAEELQPENTAKIAKPDNNRHPGIPAAGAWRSCPCKPGQWLSGV